MQGRAEAVVRPAHQEIADIDDEPVLDRRRLVARGDIVECGGIAFHRSVIEGLVPVVRELLAASPTGFTVAHLRERLGITRKHAVPLAEALDATGVTRRNGDVRVAGAAGGSAPAP